MKKEKKEKLSPVGGMGKGRGLPKSRNAEFTKGPAARKSAPRRWSWRPDCPFRFLPRGEVVPPFFEKGMYLD